MTASETDGQAAGRGWLKAALIVGAGAPALFGTFLGNIVEHLGLPGTQAPGLVWSYWVQTFFFAVLAIHAAAFLGLSRWLVGRGQRRLGGGVALLSGAAMTPLGVVVPPTLWVLAGPLAIVGGVLAIRGGEVGEAEPA